MPAETRWIWLEDYASTHTSEEFQSRIRAKAHIVAIGDGVDFATRNPFTIHGDKKGDFEYSLVQYWATPVPCGSRQLNPEQI